MAEVIAEELTGLRSGLASEILLSRLSVRRVESSISEAEELLAEMRCALAVLAREAARDAATCHELVIIRCREILETWTVGREREVGRARDILSASGLRLVDMLEGLVGCLHVPRKEEEAAAKRAEEARRLLARTDLPVM